MIFFYRYGDIDTQDVYIMASASPVPGWASSHSSRRTGDHVENEWAVESINVREAYFSVP